MKKVAIIMGSDSDFPIVKNAAMKLKEFNIPYEIHVMSAHRTPIQAAEDVYKRQEKYAKANNIKFDNNLIEN